MNIKISCGQAVTGLAAGLFALVLGASPVMADVFTVDPSQSSLTISGNVSGASFMPQGPGSLTTTYGGTIQATQTASTIQFTGSSLVTAQTNGSWQPLPGGAAGSAPADYGGTVSLYGGLVTAVAAFRSLQFDVTSPVIPVTNGQFDSSSMTFLFPTNGSSTLDYKESGLVSGSGSQPLSGNSTNNTAALATLTTVGHQQTFTLEVNVQFTFTVVTTNDTTANVAGQIVATRTLPAPLVIQTPLVTNQVVTLKWQAPAGQFYQVLSSSNLQIWQTNANNITSASTNYTWTGTNPAPAGFYRLAY